MTTSTTPAIWPAPSPATSPPLERPRQAPRRWRVRRAAGAVLVAGVAGAAIGIDRPITSLGAALIIGVAATMTARASLLPRTGRVLIAIALIAFVPWLAVRSSLWLIVPDLVAAVVLALLALSTRNGTGLTDSVGGYLRRCVRALVGCVETPAHVHLGMRTTMPSDRRAALTRSIGPLVLGVVAAGVVAAVLASGDAVFASYVDLGGLPATTAGRFLGALLLMAVTSAGTGVAIASDRRAPLRARRLAAPRSAIVSMVPLCVVYLAFVAVQVSSVALGAAYVEARTGLTYAEYARSGFFQLVAVAVATFVGIVALRPTLRSAARRDRTAILVLGGIAAGCTITMAGAAIVKLQLYADVFGLTMLRLHTTVFAAWLMLAIAIAFVSLVRPSGEWVIPVVAATALCGVFGMNIVNAERVVAQHNLTTTIGSDEFDIGYLISLSDDAVPTIVEHIDRLAVADRERAVRALCAEPGDRAHALDWNRSRSHAERARAGVC